MADGTIALSALRGTGWGASTHWGTVPANGCRAVMLVEGAGSPVKAGDLVLPGVSPALPSGIFVAPAVAPADGQPAVLVCNNSGSPVDVGAPAFVQINYRLLH